jgi:hypothetical protein
MRREHSTKDKLSAFLTENLSEFMPPSPFVRARTPVRRADALSPAAIGVAGVDDDGI